MGDRIAAGEDAPDHVSVTGAVSAQGAATCIFRAVRFAAGQDIVVAALLVSVFRCVVPSRPRVVAVVVNMEEVVVVVGDLVAVYPVDRDAGRAVAG